MFSKGLANIWHKKPDSNANRVSPKKYKKDPKNPNALVPFFYATHQESINDVPFIINLIFLHNISLVIQVNRCSLSNEISLTFDIILKHSNEVNKIH